MCQKIARCAEYLFGDGDVAARRLRLLAEVFAPSTREFIEQFVSLRPARVLDLGCGPGHTTRLLSEVFAGAMVRGLDSSQAYFELARCDPAPPSRLRWPT